MRFWISALSPITQTFYGLFLFLTRKRTARSEYVSKKIEQFFLFRISTHINWNCLFKISCRKKLVIFVLSSNSEASTKIIMTLNDKFLCTISAIAASSSTVFVLTKCQHFECVRPFHRHNVGMFFIHKYHVSKLSQGLLHCFITHCHQKRFRRIARLLFWII